MKRPRGTQSKNSGLRSQNSTAGASASVVTASVRPPARAAGMPTATATSAPTAPAASIAKPRSHPVFCVTHAPTAPPMAANAICPRLTWPAHPVSMTSDTAMIAMMPVAVAISSLLFDNQKGSESTNTAIEPYNAMLNARTIVRFRSSVGIGRTSRAACHDDTAWSSTRLLDRFRFSSSPRTMMMNSTGNV